MALAAMPLPAQNDSTWRQHGEAAEAARTARDWEGYRHHLLQVEEMVGSLPSLPVGLARAAARLGDTATAFAQLRRLAAMGVVRDLRDDPDLRSLQGFPGWAEVMRLIEANQAPVGTAETVFILEDAEAIPEDLAWDGTRQRWLVSSVRRGAVFAVQEGGEVRTLIPSGDGNWAMQGVAVDSARDRLWVTTSSLRHGPPVAYAGGAAVLRYQLSTGDLERRYTLPSDSVERQPGDLVVAPNGDVFVGDSRAGVVYRIRLQRDSLETLLAPGIVRSAQQPAVLPDGFRIAVPDYSRGIVTVDRLTGGMQWLTSAPEVVLSGIDGLIADGSTLIAIQNGVTPHRVVRLHLDREGRRVTRAEVLLRDTALLREPTHGVVRDGYLYLIANSGWDAYGENGEPRPGIRPRPARVVRIPLR